MVLQQMLRHLFSQPHRRLMVGSAILWGLGDVGAQAITHYSVSDRRAKESEDKDEEFISFRNFKIDWFRVYCASGFGAHACLLGALCLATYFPFMGYLQGKTKSVEQAKEDVKRGFKPALLLGGAVLPVALFTNWRFVPAPYQLHFNSLFALVGSCYLSWTELELHKDDAGTQRIRKMEGVRFDPTSV